MRLRTTSGQTLQTTKDKIKVRKALKKWFLSPASSSYPLPDLDRQAASDLFNSSATTPHPTNPCSQGPRGHVSFDFTLPIDAADWKFIVERFQIVLPTDDYKVESDDFRQASMPGQTIKYGMSRSSDWKVTCVLGFESIRAAITWVDTHRESPVPRPGNLRSHRPNPGRLRPAPCLKPSDPEGALRAVLV